MWCVCDVYGVVCMVCVCDVVCGVCDVVCAVCVKWCVVCSVLYGVWSSTPPLF